MSSRRLSPETRRAVIGAAAARVAIKHGFFGLTVQDVADECHIPTSPRLVRHYYPLLIDLWRAAYAAEPEKLQMEAEACGVAK